MSIHPVSPLFFGGSFNPVHNAHLLCARAAAQQAGFAQVTLVPNRQPALKADTYALADTADRVAMLELAAEAVSDPNIRFNVDTLELTREGPSYTIDTAEALYRRGLSQVHWLIGADQVLHLHRWHRFADLMQQVQFWVMCRPGYALDWSLVHPDARMLQGYAVDVPQMAISATDIRDRVRTGQPIDHLVPAKVREYILGHGLYIR